jgi:hypothetical protein
MAIELLLAIALGLAHGMLDAAHPAIARPWPTQAEELEASGRPGVGTVRHLARRIDPRLAACRLEPRRRPRP